jgi:hypothetical protein
MTIGEKWKEKNYMSSDYVEPGDVHSPRNNWVLIAVLDAAKDGECALAVGRWEGVPVLAMRWNGTKENRLGNPQSRGIPTWFIVPEKYNDALLERGGLPEDMVTLARSFIKPK